MERENTTGSLESYLTFKLQDEEFGMHVSQVLNILEMMHITKIPKLPEYLKGVIDLRGNAVPVIDTRLKTGFGNTAYDTNTCIIVTEMQIEAERVLAGAIVDEVVAVIEIQKKDILNPPEIGNQKLSNIITGMVKKDDSFIMLMDMKKLFTFSEIEQIKASSGAA